ncbi:MAG TPA: hypothetical protein VER79_13310, partial [Candidatus Limnocylindrales bacterium]|nr:hypothetical protein [Candidatus Limnocylindrales bacterium]
MARHFDFRANNLAYEIRDSWDDATKAQHRDSYIGLVGSLLADFGTKDAPDKIANLQIIGSAPFSVIAHHNRFMDEIRRAFVMFAYYPALTGAGALGERILNHLLRQLRGYYVNSPEYKRVATKDSFDNWGSALDIL